MMRKSKAVVITTVRLSEELHNKLAKLADKNARSINTEIVLILEQHLIGGRK